MTKLYRAGLLALLLVFVEQAGAGDYILPCTGTLPPRPAPAAVRVDEFPAQITRSAQAPAGTCGSYIADSNANGIVFGYWCQTAPDKTPRPWMWAVRWSALSPDMAASFLAIKLAADPGEAARLHQVKYATMSFWDMADVWCEPASSDWRVRFNAAQPIVQALSPAVWKTALTGNRIWNASGGKLVSQVSPARSAVPNTLCDCVVTKLSIGSVTYCALPAAPASEVTSCRLTP
jgi:hypothetical protein